MVKNVRPGRARPHLTSLFPEHATEEHHRRFRDVCTATNLLFYESSKEGPMVYRDGWDRGNTEVNIRRVADRKKKKMKRLVGKFPRDWPLHEQCAYILRAFSGLQLYPDANHRTGLVIAAVHLLYHRHRLVASPEEAARFVHNVRDPKSRYNTRRTVDRIRDRDGSFEYLSGFFAKNIRKMSRLGWWWRVVVKGDGHIHPAGVSRLIPIESADEEADRKSQRRS